MEDEALREDETIIALVRSGRVLDPLGRTADELFVDHRERCIVAAGFQTHRASFRSMTRPEFGPGLARAPYTSVPVTPVEQRVHDDEAFEGQLRAIEARAARIEGERRALLAAQLQRVLDLPAHSDRDVKDLAAIAAAELRLSTSSTERQIIDAWTIVTALPEAHVAAAEGRITVAHLRVIETETQHVRQHDAVDAVQRRNVTRQLVAIAETTTPSSLRKRAKRIVDAVLTEPLQARHDRARSRRRLELLHGADGMGGLYLYGSTVEVAACYDRLTQAARGKAKDDPRTFDQFRADACLELLLAGTVPEDLHGTSAIRATVAITVPATELLREPDDRSPEFPAALDGQALVDLETARRLAGDASTWERLFTDPVSGVAVTVDTYRPTAAQRRWLRSRDGGCRFVLCSNPALRADVDHTRDWADGGCTELGNLGHLCRPHHTFKHGTRWKVRQLAHGVFEWTSPTGRVMLDVPEPVGPSFAAHGPPEPWGGDGRPPDRSLPF